MPKIKASEESERLTVCVDGQEFVYQISQNSVRYSGSTDYQGNTLTTDTYRSRRPIARAIARKIEEAKKANALYVAERAKLARWNAGLPR